MTLVAQSLGDAPESHPLASVDTIIEGLAGAGYIASRRIATALYMSAHLQKPILVEGVAGVGKTELALRTAELLGLPLIRMQCYEGLDESKALYEWKYGKQLLYTQILKDHMGKELTDAPDVDSAMDRLHGMGVTVPPRRTRIVQDGKIITGGGVTSGLDFGLYVAAVLAGETVAEYIQLVIEYNPEPPFFSGEPELASDAVMQMAHARGIPSPALPPPPPWKHYPK